MRGLAAQLCLWIVSFPASGSATLGDVEPPSKSQVKKAGRVLRKYLRGDPEYQMAHTGQALAAMEVVKEFRGAHAVPLMSANNGLRSMLRTSGCPVEVSMRLKRMDTILDKICREHTLSLASMQDIGGVRAVLDDVEQIRRVEARIRKNRPVTQYSDYITTPRQSGYRGVHVVVTYGVDDRQIEIQLRTKLMHEWAVGVETLSSRRGVNYKQDGSSPAQNFMAVVSEAMAIEESGETPPDVLIRRIESLRAIAFPESESR